MTPKEQNFVVLVGQSATALRIKALLEDRGICVMLRQRLRRLGIAMASHARALIVVPPVNTNSMSTFRRLSRMPRFDVPSYVVMHGLPPEREARKLYDCGVNAIFSWPKDKQALIRTVKRLMKPAEVESRLNMALRRPSLEEIARSHLKSHDASVHDALRVRVYGRNAILEGWVDATWKKRLATSLVAGVEGIESVLGEGIKVLKPLPVQ